MAFLLETIRLGLNNLRLHKMRSILTALGIILGVAAVITMVSVGEGSKRAALLQIERLGALNIIVRSQQPPEQTRRQGGQQSSWISKFGITKEDVKVIEANFPDAPQIVPVKAVGNQIVRGNRIKASQAFGTTPDLRKVARITVARGRYLTESDMQDRAAVAVIGSEVAKELFPFEDPLGNTFRIDDKVFRVVGVLAPVGLSGGAGAALVGRDLNLDVHVPITTARAEFGDVLIRRSSGSSQQYEVQVSELYLQAPRRERVIADAARLRRIMAVRHKDLVDIGLVVPYELLENARKTAVTYGAILAAIASISLLIGGIGIMNIMLATVTERTREIGIRRALGATRAHIIWQFLVETGVLSAVGGLIGVAVGIAASLVLGWVVPHLPATPIIGRLVPADVSLPTHLAGWSILVAFAVATLTGLVFGIYPARKAAMQDPIVALRHD